MRYRNNHVSVVMVFIMTTNQLIEYLILLTISSYAFAQANVQCTLQSTGQQGICKESFDCPSVEEDAQKGIKPQFCRSSPYNFPTVCCPTDINDRYKPNDHTLLSELSATEGNLDAIVYPEDVPSVRKTEQKCEEYSKNYTSSVVAIPLVIDTKPVSLDYVKCEYNGVPLIVGGEPAAAGEFPFQAALGYPSTGQEQYAWMCGGTLISYHYVLTAAHCMARGSPVVVRLGDLDLSKEDDGSKYSDYAIKRITVHPQYNSNKSNDIALILLTKKVTFTQFVRPACLYTKSYIHQKLAVATGYGLTSFNGDSSDKLLKVSLNIYNESKCFEHYKNEFIGRTMLCSGGDGGKDTCYGDSGGPLFITPDGNQCKFYLIGVTSFGKGCGFVPAVYTKVSEYVSWIESIVW